MRNTLAYILKNYSYKPSDSHNIINNDELFEYLVMLRKNRHWIIIENETKYYFPYTLQQYLGTNQYIITLDNGKRVNIPIKYIFFSSLQKNEEVVHAGFKFNNDLTRFYIALYPSMLTFTDRAIDAIVAHELVHAKRILSGIARQPIHEPRNNKHEEFWADREAKKMLPLINPKYNNKNERRKSLIALHKEDKKRWRTTGFLQTKTGEWWDRLFPFSNKLNRYYKI